MKLYLIYIFIVINLICVELRKKKKRKVYKRPADPRDRHPKMIEPELYCDSCKAVLKESINNLYGKTKESDVLKMLDDICNPDYYKSYSNSK
jgi:hypothetical protein